MNMSIKHLEGTPLESGFPVYSHARLTRFVEGLPGDLLCQFHPGMNLNVIDKSKYDGLSEENQRKVWRTHTSIALS